MNIPNALISLHHPDYNYGELATIKSYAGLNSYKISVKEWVAKTRAIGLTTKACRYGGTYAHKDIAFEFAMWISAEFKIFLIKEFQRLGKEGSQLVTNCNRLKMTASDGKQPMGFWRQDSAGITG